MIYWADRSAAVARVYGSRVRIRVHLEKDQSTRSMKLPWETYCADPDPAMGSFDFARGRGCREGCAEKGANTGAVALRRVDRGKSQRPTCRWRMYQTESGFNRVYCTLEILCLALVPA